MDKGLEKLVALGILGLAGGLILGSRKKFEITKESNCNQALKNFNELITIHPEKVANLKKAHQTIRTKVREYFQFRTNLPLPEFYIQGSYKMKTIVENRNNKCDVDLAVIFPCNPGVSIETLQNHVKKALWNHTSKGITIKTTCVRLDYVRDFHIDLPIYFIDRRDGQLYFGSRGYEWEQSNPKAFVEWFKTQTSRKPQLIRIIRYLKAWADHTKIKTKKKLPSGLTLTLWAIKYYQPSSRDDVALFHTCTAILDYLDENFKFTWTATMPVEPFDNVLNRLTNAQKSEFYIEIKEMVALMADAVSSENKTYAMTKWKRVFGDRIS